MKRKTLLLMLLMAFAMPWAAMAQTTVFSETFGSSSIPSGWTQDATGDPQWTMSKDDSYGMGSSDYAAKLSDSNSDDSKRKLITPSINLSSYASNYGVELSFDHRQVKWVSDQDQLRVYYRTSNNGTWVELASYTSEVSTVTNQKITLPAAACTSTCQIAFEGNAKYGRGVFVDDVQITATYHAPVEYTISSPSDWSTFKTNVENGSIYANDIVKLNNNLSVTSMVGTSSKPFCGTFDGQGNTLNVTISGSSQGTAPFQYISGATIKNLKVTGTVTGSGDYHTGGLVGFAWSGINTIQNCVVSTDITIKSLGGGIVGHGKTATTNIIGCVYNGYINNTLKEDDNNRIVGGMFGWCDEGATINITDCLFDGTYGGTGSATLFHPMAGKAGGKTVTNSITNCYYTLDQQGTDNSGNIVSTSGSQHGYLVALVVNPNGSGTADGGTPNTNHGFVKAYSHGLLFNSVYYANGSISLKATANSGYVFTQWSGTGTSNSNPYDVTISTNSTYTANFASTCTVTYNANGGSGTMTDPNSPYASGSTVTVLTNAFTAPSGQTFNGWNTAANGSGTAYAEGATFTISANTTLYAQWTVSSEMVVEIGDGTGTTGNAPLHGNYNYSYDQMIYTAAQLQAVGINTGGTITKIAFNAASANANRRETVIYMGHTSKSTFSNENDFIAFADSDLTKVYDYSETGNSTWKIEAGWNEFVLDTPFDYDGTSNLVIAMYCHGSYKSTSFYYTSATDQVLRASDDNKNPNPLTYDGSWNSYGGSYKSKLAELPNLKMHFEPSNYIHYIRSTEDWDEFCTTVNGVYDYSGKTVHLAADIDANEKMVGTTSHKFAGTFKGGGHIITFNYTNTDADFQYIAPFRYINNATIQDVKVTGKVSTNYKFAGGVVANAAGTSNVINCINSTAITGTGSSNSHGGIVGQVAGGQTINITGCVFNGTMTGESNTFYWCGILGYGSSSTTANITNCLFAPRKVSVGGSNNRTIYRCDGTVSIPDCYYTQPMNNNQGTRVYSVTGNTDVDVVMSGTASTTYNVSGFSLYSPGLIFNDTIYGASDNQVSLNLSFTGSGTVNSYQADNGTLNGSATTGSNDAYTLTMTANNTVISVNVNPVITEIYDNDDWNEFALTVRNGYSYSRSGETVHLRGNISITSQDNQAGSANNLFKGTFEGHGNTITVNITSANASGKHCAPFYGIQNATINDLVVTGSISSAYQGVAGVCGVVYGNSTFNNCISDVDITSTCSDTPGDGTGWSTCGGFVGYSGAQDYPTFVGCAFTGSLTATRENCGGFVGFHASRDGWTDYYGVCTFTNCLFAPSSINISKNNTCVFACGYTNGGYLHITVTNSYYNEEGAKMNRKQGTRAYVVTLAASPAESGTISHGTVGTTYSTSTIVTYGTGNGIDCGGIFYAPAGSFDLTATGNDNNEFQQWSDGNINNPRTVTISGAASYTAEFSGGCAAPTNFRCTAYSVNWATLDWNAGGEETEWVISYWPSGTNNKTDITTSDKPCTITDLTRGTLYFAQVRAVCDPENEQWSEPTSFTPQSVTYTFTNNGGSGNGMWDVANNWDLMRIPTTDDDVIIDANVTIPDDCVAKANNITVNSGDTITIKDGGQLWHSNDNNDEESKITVTIEKEITAPTVYDNTNKGFEIISFPVEDLNPNDVTGLQQGNYDFFCFSPYNNVSEDEIPHYLEWMHVDEEESLSLLQGYLYANEDTVTISVTGRVMSSANGYDTDEAYTPSTGTARFDGWYLIGNPFVCNAYLTANAENLDFYKIRRGEDSEPDEFEEVDSSDPIEPMGGVMVYVEVKDNLSYRRTPSPQEGQSGILNMVARKANSRASASRLDRARLRFGTGRNLPKLQLNPNHTKVYIPEGAKDYAVYYTEGAGSMPVNFKAEENGRYTLDFSTENVSFNYLHLIDNMTGADVDLLETPYYTFSAKSTDYESRFKVVFATGEASNDDNFAFYSNGSWVVNNEGEATLQVIDVMGHVLSSERISGATTKAINAASGIYMLRLINGDNVRVQKIVVR